MHHYSLLQLREMADQLSIVAYILRINPFYLRSKQIRQVDKALGSLEHLLTPQLVKEAEHWKESFDGLQILNKKLESIDKTQIKIVNLEKEIDELKILTRSWYSLDEEERNLLVKQAERASEFLKIYADDKDESVIDRYKRSLELKDLMIYADKIPHICDSIWHHMQKERYHQNLEKINERIIFIRKQIKLIKRGFWMAIVLFLFVATIPICLPFAITLWKRQKRLTSHLMMYEDMQRREHKRLALADEGDVVLQEIQTVVGEVSYETAKNLLMEVKELKSEFHDPNRFLSLCAMILNFIDTREPVLVSLFSSPVPEQPKDRFAWLVNNVRKFENAFKKLESLQDERRDLYIFKKQTTKGYDREILIHGIYELNLLLKSMIKVSFSFEHKALFAVMCVQLPDIFRKIREAVFYASQNYYVDLNAWNSWQSKVQEYAQQLSMFVLDSEINEHKNKQKNQEFDIRPETAAVENLNEGVNLCTQN